MSSLPNSWCGRSLVMVIHERADGGSEVFLAEWHDAV
jgi:hypothetical protein